MTGDPSMDDADREVAGHAAIGGVMAVTGFELALLRHPLLGGLAMAVSFIALWNAHRHAKRLNQEPEGAPTASSLNGRLDIFRSSRQ